MVRKAIRVGLETSWYNPRTVFYWYHLNPAAQARFWCPTCHQTEMVAVSQLVHVVVTHSDERSSVVARLAYKDSSPMQHAVAARFEGTDPDEALRRMGYRVVHSLDELWTDDSEGDR